MRKLYKPRNEVELSLIKSIFDGDNIHYFVHNDNFGSLKIGPQIDLFNARMIMVHEEHYDRASDLIADFLKNIEEDTDTTQSQYSLFDKIRMIIEVMLFSWFVPGKSKKVDS